MAIDIESIHNETRKRLADSIDLSYITEELASEAMEKAIAARDAELPEVQAGDPKIPPVTAVEVVAAAAVTTMGNLLYYNRGTGYWRPGCETGARNWRNHPQNKMNAVNAGYCSNGSQSFHITYWD